MKLRSLIVGLTITSVLFVMSGCGQESPNNIPTPPAAPTSNATTPPAASTDPISFSTGDLKVTVAKDTVVATTLFTVEGLKGLESDCGTTHPEGYFENIISKLNGMNATVYKIKSNESPEEEYDITVMPNTLAYADMAAFKKDFDVCAAGGTYPKMVNQNWLVFTGSCGSAYDEKPALTCGQISEVVDPTLKFL